MGKYRVLRDPIHTNISFDLGNSAERLAVELVAAPEWQRLRQIRQLGLASLVYHGAEHSRFSHTLGVTT